MPIEKWRPILLAILAVALAGVVYVEWPQGADAVRTTSTSKAAGGRTPLATNTLTAPDVHLKSLEEEHTKPGDVERDLFRFKTRPAPPPATTRPAVAIAPPPVVPSGPPPPPPLPPITLRFIGVLESANTQKIAVLSDGRGAPLYGKEGETVLGQYKILHIGVESIEMAYLDGRGRQTIRLSGS
jgi:hypothetical protein